MTAPQVLATALFAAVVLGLFNGAIWLSVLHRDDKPDNEPEPEHDPIQPPPAPKPRSYTW